MNTDTAIELALRCYPGWWQDRYANEVRTLSHDLTADGRSPVRVALNLVGGAVQARARGRGMPKSYGLWTARTRTSIAAATLPWLLVAPLLWASFGSESFHSSAGPVFWSGFSAFPTHLQTIQHAQTRSSPPLTYGGHLILDSALAITVLILITFFVLFSGWCGLTRGIRQTNSSGGRKMQVLAWAPVFALLVDVLLLMAEGMTQGSGEAGYQGHYVAVGAHPAAHHILVVALPTVAIVGWLVSVACVSVAARRADVPPVELRFGKSVAVVVASLFVLLVAAYATWGVGMVLQSRQAVQGGFTTVGYAHAGLWLPMMLVLVVAVALSVASARAARGAWKTVSVTFL
jgi:hypothetical protein